MRSVGLRPDGPVVWGAKVRSRKHGVYIVETADPLARAPIDPAAVDHWISRVPGLRLDGARPTAGELGRRLAEFWIPDEAVVYVGLAGTNLASRIRGYYRTPLGDPRPHAGGHWLKTLQGLNTFLVSWAETDEPDRYEGELLAAFAEGARESARGLAANLVLPFANRANALGTRKPHGITGSTLPHAAARSSSLRESAQPALPTAQVSRTGLTDRLGRINAALQVLACSQSERRITAVDGARELDRRGLLKDSPTRPGLPLRNLLRAGQIYAAYQEAGRWWFIACMGDD